MSHRAFLVALLAALGIGATWSACSSEEKSTPASGGADGGGTAAIGGGTGASTSGGGGKGGTGADSGDWGQAPTWEAIAGTVAGCTFERMTNAAQVRFFKWEPCSWTEGCEQAVFNEGVFGKDPTFVRTSSVIDDGTTGRVGLTMWDPRNIAMFAEEAGMGAEAVRVTAGALDCRIVGTSVWNQRCGVFIEDKTIAHFGGIVGDIGSAANAPVAFTIPEPPPSGGTQQYVLGEARWMWWWVPGDRLSSVSAKDGSGFQIFTKVGGPILEYTGLTTTGPLFLMEEFTVQDGGAVQARVAYSDGASPTKPYLVPTDPNDDYGQPAFANTHVAFMRGVARKAPYTYDHAEIWASPYSANPSELKPEFVATLSFTNMPVMVGGWGHVATAVPTVGDGGASFGVWSLANKSVKSYSVPPGVLVGAFLGVTRSNLWVGAASKGAGSYAYLVRVDVE